MHGPIAIVHKAHARSTSYAIQAERSHSLKAERSHSLFLSSHPPVPLPVLILDPQPTNQPASPPEARCSPAAVQVQLLDPQHLLIHMAAPDGLHVGRQGGGPTPRGGPRSLRSPGDQFIMLYNMSTTKVGRGGGDAGLLVGSTCGGAYLVVCSMSACGTCPRSYILCVPTLEVGSSVCANSGGGVFCVCQLWRWGLLCVPTLEVGSLQWLSFMISVVVRCVWYLHGVVVRCVVLTWWVVRCIVWWYVACGTYMVGGMLHSVVVRCVVLTHGGT